jgi:hypothetical protein
MATIYEFIIRSQQGAGGAGGAGGIGGGVDADGNPIPAKVQVSRVQLHLSHITQRVRVRVVLTITDICVLLTH